MNVGSILVPAWAKWVGLAAGLALFIACAAWANKRFFINPAVNAETARWERRWNQRDIKDQQALIDFTAEQRRIELKRQADAEQIQKDAQKEIDRMAALRAAADRNSERLQQGIANAIAQLQRERGEYSGAGTGSPTGASTGNMLTQLYREIDATAGELAAEADRARRAGLTCERQYDAIRGQ